MRQIDEIRGADAAVEFALRTAQPGELILVQADTVDETVQFIRRYMESITPEPVLAVEEAPAPAPAAKPAGGDGRAHRQGRADRAAGKVRSLRRPARGPRRPAATLA